jgi:hypothetical protein
MRRRILAKVEKVVKLAKDTWLVLGVTLLFFLLVESGFSLAFLIKDYFVTDSLAPSRAKADTYLDASWVDDYYKEFHRSFDAKWTPYVYWRRKPFQGKYININSDGIRLTLNTPTSQKEAGTSAKIFVFGGSAIWGTGARDGFTIPSTLAKELRNKGIACAILNFGESGYVSTQEVIALLLQLQKGNIPHIVIFYDGVNDTYSAYQQHVAGLPQNEFNRVREFNLSNSDHLRQRSGMVLRDAAGRLSTLRFLNGLLQRFGVRSPLFVHNSASDSKSLTREVVTTYVRNVELVMALGAHYNFKSIFYWQPTIFQKKHLTAYERSEQQKEQDLETFFQNTYDVMRQSSLAQESESPFQDLSMVFVDVREPLYIDWSHLGEVGNAMIAQRMAKDVLFMIGAGKSAAEQNAAPHGDSDVLHRCR